MKNIFILMIALATSSCSLAQSKLINYFKKLPKAQQHHYTITKKGSSYVADAGTGDVPVTIDEANGYLEFTDNGTGGGNTKFQMAIFKDANGGEVLAVSCYGYGDMINNNGLNFFRASTTLTDITYDKSVIDDWTVFTDKAVEDAGDFSSWTKDVPPYEYFELPRKGTTITLHYGINGVDHDCELNQNPEACALKKKFKPVSMYWHKENGGYFSLNP